VQGLLTIITRFSNFSKIEAGKLDLELIDIDLRDYLRDVARLLAIASSRQGIGNHTADRCDRPRWSRAIPVAFARSCSIWAAMR